jgi:DNA-binding XRE family transcriptional regulator
MKESKKAQLEKKGWRVGDAREFLGLSKEEEAFIDLKLALAKEVEAKRKAKGLTQAEVAHRIGSSQSRVAKMEGGDPAVSLDLLLKTLLKLGANMKDIGETIAAA